jgi:hypothetical protein
VANDDYRRITAKGSQPSRTGEGWGTAAGAGMALAGIGAAGFYKTNTGRVWDSYLRGIKNIETLSPGAILRTFRLSETFSPLASWSQLGITAAEMDSPTVYGSYLRRVFGDSSISATMARTGSVFGEVRDEAGKLIGMGLHVDAGTQRGATIADYYARITGTNLGTGADVKSLSEGILRARWAEEAPHLKYKDYKAFLQETDPSKLRPSVPLMAGLRSEVDILGRQVKLTQAQSTNLAKAEVSLNFMRARMATTVGRLNNLLQKPFEVPIIGDMLQKIPIINNLAIEPGTHSQMLGRYVKKGLIAGAVYKGLEYYDYLRSEGSLASLPAGAIGGAAIGGLLFKGAGSKILPYSTKGAVIGAAVGLFTAVSPRFESGLFHGTATYLTDLNIARANMSFSSGMTDSLRKQQEITPGLVSFGSLLGMTGVGAVIGGMAGYGGFLNKVATSAKGRSLYEVADELRPLVKETFQEKWGSALGKVPGVGKYLSKIKSPGVFGAFAGAVTWLAASSGLSILSGNFMAGIPGLNLLGTTETSEELQKVYSGEEDVAIRKGRWWEFGRSSGYEGGRILYYRQHWLPRLKERAFQKGLWGSEEEKWEHDPMLNPIDAIFGSDDWKYYYEKKYQQSRPAPLTGTYFEDVPFVGPLLAATVGKLLKPRKYVRPEEWMLGEGEYKHYPGPRPEAEPAYELGGLDPGAPVSPDDPSQLFNELLYRRREGVGLVGFAAASIQKALTGREEVFQNLQTLGTMGGETSSEYWLWSHLNVGGAAGTSEAIRRFIPHKRSYLQEYNPLRADVPSWFPKDYFLDYEHGNPFDVIPEAEIRMPGPGYAALNPEVAGLTAEEYPLIHKLKILSDVAMWSQEYRSTLSEALGVKDSMTEQELNMLGVIREQVKSKKIRREFSEYKFREEELAPMNVHINKVLSPNRVLTEELGDMTVELQGIGSTQNAEAAMAGAVGLLQGREVQLMVPALESRRYDRISSGGRMRAVAMIDGSDYSTIMSEQGLTKKREYVDEFEQLKYSGREKMAGRTWEALSRAVDTPLELLTPASPASKFIRMRSAIEEYATTEAIGTGSAFWDRPVENFIGPAIEMSEYKMGDRDIPKVTHRRRSISEYFDMLDYTKQSLLEKRAYLEGDMKAAKEATKNKNKTLFGLNPFSNPTVIMQAMPRRERDFFSEFINAKTEEDRQKILELVPEQEARIYKAQWARQEVESIIAKKEAGIDTNQDDLNLSSAMKSYKSDGYNYDEETYQRYLVETNGDVPFDEWLRRKLLRDYFKTKSLPGPNWLGWHPAVDLKDVEAKYLQSEGLDHHDFDIWGDRMQALSRKPYIDEEVLEELSSVEDLTEESREQAKIYSNAKALASSLGASSSDIIVSRTGLPDNALEMNISDGRKDIIDSAYEQIGYSRYT